MHVRLYRLRSCSVGSVIQQAAKADAPEDVTSADLQHRGISVVLPDALLAFTSLG